MLISSLRQQIAYSNAKYHFIKMAKQPKGMCSSLFQRENFPKVNIYPLTVKSIVHSTYLINNGAETGQIHFDSTQNLFRIPTKLLHKLHVANDNVAREKKEARDEEN